MKIGFSGLELPEGKMKYKDDKFNALAEKCGAEKLSPLVVEFVRDEFIRVDSIVIPKDKLLDLLILDMEKLEGRMQNTEDGAEKEFIRKCTACLEKETPLCDVKFNEAEQKYLQMLSPLSMKPVLALENEAKADEIVKKLLEKSGITFFFTAGPEEVHAWEVKKGSDIVACAGKIHTDLARGFIKADIAGFEDFLNSHNFNDARTKGLVKLVDRDYIIREGDIVEIRYNT